MRLLLDTHIFLWYITGDQRVGASVRGTIEDAEAAYLSVASVWETTIKYYLGKLALPEPPHPGYPINVSSMESNRSRSTKRQWHIFLTSPRITAILLTAFSCVRRSSTSCRS